MNYRFESIYTAADQLKWQIEASQLHREETKTHNIPLLLAVVFQFGCWATIFYGLLLLDLPFLVVAILLYLAFLLVGGLYDKLIHPHIVVLFDQKTRMNKSQKFSAIIDVDDEKIRTQYSDREVILNWSSIQGVEDNERNVILIAEGGGYCLIPGRCFSGFLAKDAFVRDCLERISGKTEQGAYFT